VISWIAGLLSIYPNARPCCRGASVPVRYRLGSNCCQKSFWNKGRGGNNDAVTKPAYHRKRSWSNWPKPSLPPPRLPCNKHPLLLWVVKLSLPLKLIASARRSSPLRADLANLSLFTHPLLLPGRRMSSTTRSTVIWVTPSRASASLESSLAGGHSPSAQTLFQMRMTSLSSQGFSKTSSRKSPQTWC